MHRKCLCKPKPTDQSGSRQNATYGPARAERTVIGPSYSGNRTDKYYKLTFPEGIGSTKEIQVDHNPSSSRITVTTRPEQKDTTDTRAAKQCLNPQECPNIRENSSESEYERLGSTLRRKHEKLLQDACKEMNSREAEAFTVDDVEDIMEIFRCNEIERKLQKLIQEKRRKLETRRSRRETYFAETKLEFHRSLIESIDEDRKEQSRLHETIKELIPESQLNSTTADDRGNYERVDVTVSRGNGFTSQFRPGAESTRIDFEDMERSRNRQPHQNKYPHASNVSDELTFRTMRD